MRLPERIRGRSICPVLDHVIPVKKRANNFRAQFENFCDPHPAQVCGEYFDHANEYELNEVNNACWQTIGKNDPKLLQPK